MPRAVRATFLRILIFYILTILTIGLCINNQDPTLLTAANGRCLSSHRHAYYWLRAAFARFERGCVAAHGRVRARGVRSRRTRRECSAAHRGALRDELVLLRELARHGQAPRVFGWVNARGVPIPSLVYVFPPHPSSSMASLCL